MSMTEDEALAIHRQLTVVEGHAHHLQDVFHKRQKGGQKVFSSVHLPQLQAGGVGVVLEAFFVEAAYKPERSVKRAIQLIGSALADLDETPGVAVIVRSKDDLQRAIGEGRPAIIMGLEGGEPIEDSVESLRTFYELGIRFLQISYNERNRLCDGIDEEEWSRGGLTRAGVETVKEANRLGIVLDAAHIAQSSFWHLLEISSDPVMNSHCACRDVHDHKRNMTDEQIRAIAAKGGVVGVTAAATYLASGGATIETYVDRIDRIVQMVGPAHVGVGPDYFQPMWEGGYWHLSAEFYWANVTEGFENVTTMPNVTRTLLRRGYSVEDVRLIMGGSFLRLFERVLR